MKNNNVKVNFSEGFSNKINLPVKCRQALLCSCTITEKLTLFHFIDGNEERPEDMELEIYAVKPDYYDEGKVSYGKGYVVHSTWNGWLWYCESVKDVQRITEDYEKYIRRQIPIEWNWIKILSAKDVAAFEERELCTLR